MAAADLTVLGRRSEHEIGTSDWSHQLYESKPWLQHLDVLNVNLHRWTLCFTSEDDQRQSDVAELERWYRHDGAISHASTAPQPSL